MTVNKHHLAVRSKKKATKPSFKRQYTNVMPQFEGQWRRPRGVHSKMRHGFRGKGSRPSVGWQSPRSVRGLSADGRMPVLVSNLAALTPLNAKEHVLTIASAIGGRKRILIFQKAKEMQLTFMNVDLEKELQSLQADFAKRTASHKKPTTEVKKQPEKKAPENVAPTSEKTETHAHKH